MNHLALIEEAGQAAGAATDPESALRALMTPAHGQLGQRDGGADRPDGVEQFFVAGAFLVTPDEAWHMLVGNLGFPDEQERLMIPIDGGHPGRVCASRQPIHLPDTEAGGQFKQYLKTARMGSSIYAPMIWKGRFLGQIVIAGRVANTLGEADFAVMRALAPMAAAHWMAQGGDAWLAGMYPPENGFRVNPEGM